MKKNVILSGAVAVVALGAINASAQFNYQNGDMIAAFGIGTTPGTAPDVIVDLGPISQFQGFNFASYTWNLSSVLTAQYGSGNSSIYWAVFGVNDTTTSPFNNSVHQGDPNTVWATMARANPATMTHAPLTGSSGLQLLTVGDIQSIASLTNPNQASPGMIVNYAAGIELVTGTNASLGGFSQMMDSGNFQGDWLYNVLNTGTGVSDLYQSDPTALHATYLGNFSLSSGDVLTFNGVPEPSTWAMFGSGILALLALRRRK